MISSEQKFFEKINLLLSQNRSKSALKTARSANKVYPKNPIFQNLTGYAHAKSGNHREAALLFSAAVKLAPRNLEFQNNLLQALVFSDQFEKVDALVARWVPQRQSDADLQYLHAMSLLRRDLPERALLAVEQAIAAKPAQSRMFWLRSKIFDALGQEAQALRDLSRLQILNPGDHRPLLESADILMRQSKIEDSRSVLAQALDIAPQDPMIHASLGRLELALGRPDQAITHYHRVIQLQPENGMAFYQLAKLQPKSANVALEPMIREAQKNKGLSAQDVALLGFAQAIISKQDNDQAAEARCLKHANRTEAAKQPYDFAAATRRFECLSGATAIDYTDVVEQAPVPIFVLGLPRSGTSLLEQVLTVPNTVYSCGELGGGERFFAFADANNLDRFSPTEMAQTYRSRLPDFPDGVTHFVDKLPHNYRVIGLLHAAFPNARFLHVQRDPRDTALSMWRAYLSAPDLNYTFDQTAMAHEVNLYSRYMTMWKAALGDIIFDVPYAALVGDVVSIGRETAAFCGIPWTQDMAHPDRNAGIVRTASSIQVRQPVHQRSVGVWQDHKAMLKPFIDGLDPTLWSELS